MKGIWAGQGCVLSDLLHILTHFVFLTTLWDWHYYCPNFIPAKTEVQGSEGTRSIISQITRQIGIHTEGNWGPEAVFLPMTSLGEGASFSYLLMVVPLSHAEGNETLSPVAGSNFSVRKCRNGFFMSNYQGGGAP